MDVISRKRMEDFKRLLSYYKKFFSLIDCFHYNSDITKNEYEKHLESPLGKTVTITHKGIGDHRHEKFFSETGLQIGFIGNETPYKGLQELLKAVEGLDIDVHVWGGRKKEEGQIHYRGKFSKDQIGKVYNMIDLLVVPSVCKETFSLVVLEAMSYGVPVLVSNNVGAQILVKEYYPPFIYETPERLREILQRLLQDKSPLIEYNKKLLLLPWKHSIKDHVYELIEYIYKA